MSENRKVYVLLTSLTDCASRMVQFITNYPYSHASLGLEEDPNTFYSFTFKGFTVEDITRKASKPDRKPFDCLLYEIEVSEETYQEIRDRLEVFQKNREAYKYSKIGAVMSVLFHIPIKRKNRFFCSQFVADVLKHSSAAEMKKWSPQYLPHDFSMLQEAKLRFRGNLSSYLRHFNILPVAKCT